MSEVIDTICEGFSAGENTDEKVQLQIVKVLNDSFTVIEGTWI